MKKNTFLRALGILLSFYLFVLIFDGTIPKKFEIGKRFLQEQVKYGNFWGKIDKIEKLDNSRNLPKILDRENHPKDIQSQRKQQEKKSKQSNNANGRNRQNMKNKKSTFQEKEMGKKDQKFPKRPKIQAITNDLKIVLQHILQRGFHDNEQILCKKGYYILKGMKECKPWLACHEINNPKILERRARLGGGIGKLVYHGLLNGQHSVAIVTSRNPDNQRLAKRVQSGNENVVQLQPSPFVIQVLGLCDQGSNSTIITESCDSCMDLFKVWKRNKGGFKKFEDKTKVEWLIQIISGFDLLHHSMPLPRVHCDLHTPNEFLSQFILMEYGRLVMADLDELPEVNEKMKIFATCQEETNGIMKTPDFIAPEQRYTEQEFKQGTSRKPITEKSDIWKIPDIAKVIMKDSDLEENLMQNMEKIHSKCQNRNPKLRPTARTILIEYLTFYKAQFL